MGVRPMTAVATASEAVAIPLDPESLDATRPTDLDCCPICAGDGAVQVQSGDPYPGAWDGEECWACAGTGTRGAA